MEFLVPASLGALAGASLLAAAHTPLFREPEGAGEGSSVSAESGTLQNTQGKGGGVVDTCSLFVCFYRGAGFVGLQDKISEGGLVYQMSIGA